jgi:hypothetical protein
VSDPNQDEYDHADTEFGPFAPANATLEDGQLAEALDHARKAARIMAELGHTKYALGDLVSREMLTHSEMEVSQLLGKLARAEKLAEDNGVLAHQYACEAIAAKGLALDFHDALQRLLVAHQPKPFGGITDAGELRKAESDRTTEILEATHHARQTLSKLKAPANTTLERTNAKNLVEEALQWYEEQTRNCRKITSEGQAARANLDADGGLRARVALEAWKEVRRHD